MKLSKNFSLREMTRSQTATRKGIDNTPDLRQTVALAVLTVKVLQPIRDQFGPVSVNSGFRCDDLNIAIGGTTKSQHGKGEAADIEVMGVDNYKLAKFIEKNLEYDQLILEGYKEGDKNSGWIHVSYSLGGKNRNSTLTATFDSNGNPGYAHGIYK